MFRFVLFALVLPSLLASTTFAGQVLYLSSNQEKTITCYEIDQDTGGLTKRYTTHLDVSPGAMTFSPDQSFVYAVVGALADGKFGVTTLRRNADDTLGVVATSTLTTRAPYLCTDAAGKYLLAAHYGAGDVTVYRITDGIATSELLDQEKTDKTAHCIEVDPSGRYVFVPHTAPNKVYQFRLDSATGQLTPSTPAFVTGPDEDHYYHQPRHYAHHPKLHMAYTSNERGGGISAWKFDPDRGTLELTQTLSTLPPNYEGTSAGADIWITPDGRFAYVSNRDSTERKEGAHRDTLCGVALDPKSGAMKIVGYYPTPRFPRAFCIDVTGSYVYSAGQGDAKLASYRIDPKTGALESLTTYETGGTPLWVMCAKSR